MSISVLDYFGSINEHVHNVMGLVDVKINEENQNFMMDDSRVIGLLGKEDDGVVL